MNTVWQTEDAVVDELGRSFRSLRISVTALCNFACRYCAPQSTAEQAARFPAPQALLDAVRRMHHANAFHTVRITGGEPTLYPHLNELCRGLKDLGIERVALTSNGLRLSPLLPELRASGLDDVNVSLDALDPETHRRLGGRGEPGTVLDAVDRATELGFGVKLNCTVLRGHNERELRPLLQASAERRLTIRYLEFMRMGPVRDDHEQLFFSEQDILTAVLDGDEAVELSRESHATARYWRVESGPCAGSVFGIIANHSRPFCGDCDRLRLDAAGRIYGCLSSARGHELPRHAAGIRDVLRAALADKRRDGFTGSELSMKEIGG